MRVDHFRLQFCGTDKTILVISATHYAKYHSTSRAMKAITDDWIALEDQEDEEEGTGEDEEEDEETDVESDGEAVDQVFELF